MWLEKNGDIRFAPTPGFVGTGSFAYTLQTPGGELVERLATVLVHNVNDFPLLSDDTFSLPEGEIFYLDRLLANDRDPDGDTLLLDHFRGIEHGQVALTNGQLAFVPEQGYHGDIEFSYWIRDHVTSYPVMASATLTYTDVNEGPVAGDDRFIIIEETPLVTSVDKILANDIEHDGEVVTFVDLGSAVHGMVGMQADGSILFMPAVDYAGTEAGFHYHVQDGSGNIATGWVAVEVLDRREAPVVLDGARGQIQEDEILTFSPEEIRTFVYDPDGDALHLERITNVTGGTIVVHGGYYAFVPHAEYSGLASFDYLVSDNHQGTVAGHLELDVIPVNDAIDTGTDVLSTDEEQLATTSIAELLANDRDVDGSTVTFVAIGESSHGTVAVDDNGTIAFTPEVDYCGEEAGFLYIVEDSEGLASIGQARVLVAGVNDAPGSRRRNPWAPGRSAAHLRCRNPSRVA